MKKKISYYNRENIERKEEKENEDDTGTHGQYILTKNINKEDGTKDPLWTIIS